MYKNVSCFVGPPIPLKKIIIHEIIHEIEIFSIYVFFQQIK